jgi:hypothetical protein
LDKEFGDEILGTAERVDGGWQVNGVVFKEDKVIRILVRGFYGASTASLASEYRETVRIFFKPDDSFCFPIKSANDNVAVICL